MINFDFSAAINSPFDTTSAPKPNFAISFNIFKLLFALTEKHINGFIVLKFFLKFKTFFFSLLYE